MPRREKNWNRVGANFELMIMKDLQCRGYTVMRSSGSKGVVDVHAVGEEAVRLYIQAKISNPVIPPAERIALIDVARRGGGAPVVAYRDRGTVLYRFLMGPEPKEWTAYTPPTCGWVPCGECGHQRMHHSEPGSPRDLGCWNGPVAGRSCYCPTFILPA